WTHEGASSKRAPRSAAASAWTKPLWKQSEATGSRPRSGTAAQCGSGCAGPCSSAFDRSHPPAPLPHPPRPFRPSPRRWRVIMVRRRESGHRDYLTAAVFHAASREHAVRDVLELRGATPQDDHLETQLVAQVHVHRGTNLIPELVLNLVQFLAEI